MRARVPSQSAPRGTASFRAPSGRARVAETPASLTGHPVVRRRPPQLVGLLEDLGAPAHVGKPQQRLTRAGIDLELADRRLEADEVVHRELLEEAPAAVVRNPELVEELTVEIGVAEADHRPGQ